MKATRVIPVALAAASALALAPTPSHAATDHPIAGPRANISSGDLWYASKCNPTYVGSPADGIDSQVAEISSFAASHSLTISWTATVHRDEAGGGLMATFIDNNCFSLQATNPGSGTTPGTWSLYVPTGAKWVLINNTGALFDVHMTF